jgi:hypothetical protein
MKTVYRLIVIVILAAIGLTACNSSPNLTPPASVPNPTATPAASVPNSMVTPVAGYPAPQVPSAQQSTSYPAPQSISTSQAVPETGYPAMGNLQIIKSNGSVSPLTSDALKGLPLTKVTLEGKEENVRKLADALNLAGITTFNKATVTSPTGTIALTKDQVAQSYLDVANDGSIRLMIQGISKDRWPNAVISIKIE